MGIPAKLNILHEQGSSIILFDFGKTQLARYLPYRYLPYRYLPYKYLALSILRKIQVGLL